MKMTKSTWALLLGGVALVMVVWLWTKLTKDNEWRAKYGLPALPAENGS